MTATDTTIDRTWATPALVLPAFAATIGASAFLLFSVEPMFAKMVLPRLGGSASVWSVALVFFQAMLLAGYAFAHLLTRRLSVAVAIGVHLMVCIAAAVMLPIALPANWGTPPDRFTELWVLALFAVAVGLPFFAVAVNGPLLQAWFARTGHPHARDPYFLYGASNLGSFAALVAYPLVIEPTIGVTAQSRLWSGGFLALALAVLALGLLTARLSPAAVAHTPVPARPIALARRARWIFLAFVPSALLVALTAHVSTDVAAAPFLWVLPLSLFLLTFVIVFQRRPLVPHATALAVQPLLLAAVIAVTALPVLPLPARIGVELLAFFVAALVAHGELAADRPEPENLTAFYLWMSLGGVLGGIFAGLLAPQIFATIAEYPILLVATVATRPGLLRLDRRTALRALGPVAAIAIVLASTRLLGYDLGSIPAIVAVAAITIAVGAIVWARGDDLRLLATLAIVILALQAFTPGLGTTTSIRSFYGVNRIAESSDGHFRFLFSGTTIHVAQRLRGADGTAVSGPPRPATYYWPGSPMADVIAATRAQRGGTLPRLITVGLGTGSLACHKRPGESWTFYEIDPEVVRIARDPTRFRFLSDCAPGQEIVVGDGRLTLADHGGAAADVLIVDAFASDSIPVHLLTREAIALYTARLAPHGVMAFHLQNKHMELTRVAAALATADGWTAWVRVGRPDAAGVENHDFQTTVVVLARDPADVARLVADPEWRRMAPETTVTAWTDDHADVLDAILRKYRGDGPRLVP